MKKWMFAKPNHWFTQKELKEKELRLFLKMLPNIEPEKWEEWDNEQRKEYLKDHKIGNIFGMLKNKPIVEQPEKEEPKGE